MKQSTLLIAAATTLLLASSAIAQSVRPIQLAPRHETRDARPLASAAAPEWRFIDSLGNAFSFYSNGADPFTYDGRLNVLALAKRGAPQQEGAGNRVWIYASTNLGLTWAAPFGPITDPTAAGAGSARYPSVLVNPTHSTNPGEYFYYYNAPMVVGPDWVAHAAGLLAQDGQEVIQQTLAGPIGEATWSSDARNIETTDGAFVISAGSVSNNGIGVRRMDLSSGAMTQSIPPALDNSNFIVPGPNERTSTVAGIGTDASGGIHLLIWARTAAGDAAVGDSMAMPYISKSTDNGLTWSPMMMLPGAMLASYVTTEGFDIVDSSFIGWGPAGFAVLGPDRYSIVFPYINIKFGGPRHQLLEARYNAGNWNIFKITDMNLYAPLDNGDGDFEGQQVQNEVQMVKTVDGNTLVVKWNQLISYITDGDIDGKDAADKPDTFTTTDVFVVSRATTQGTWSEPKNVTNSEELDRLTWIPTNVIPNDLTQLPLLEVQAVIDEVEDTTQLEKWVDGQQVLVDRTQLVFVTNVDATPVPSSAPIAGEATASRIGSIAPNPSAGAAIVTVSVAKGGNGSIELWNALGERIAVLADGNLRTGTSSYAIPGAELPVGAYYVALKIDGQTITQPFSVVR